MTGTLINVGTVLSGGAIGFLVGSRFPGGMRHTLIQAIGLTTLVIGLQRALLAENVLILLGSVALGTVIGELLGIEAKLERLAVGVRDWGLGVRDRGVGIRGAPAQPDPEAPPDPQSPIPNPQSPTAPTPNPQPPTPERGFVTASLIFCVGPMTILGCFEDGLTGAYQTLAVKATLDGVMAALLASSLGWGVLLAAGTVLLYQGALTLSAGLLRGLLSDAMIAEMTATGGLLIVGIGVNILELARIRVGNMLPALVIAPALVALAALRGAG